MDVDRSDAGLGDEGSLVVEDAGCAIVGEWEAHSRRGSVPLGSETADLVRTSKRGVGGGAPGA